MSYDVFLFTKGTKDKQVQSGNPAFVENDEELVPFTPEQFERLKKGLSRYKYQLTGDRGTDLEYVHSAARIKALLTHRGLYFSAGFDQDSIFEAGMTASELSDTGEFQKFDPQSGGWEGF